MALKNKERKIPQFEVFSQVVATVSNQVLTRIEGNKADFLTNLLQPVNVFVHSSLARDEHVITIYGRLENIIRTRAVLETKLLSDVHHVTKKGKELACSDQGANSETSKNESIENKDTDKVAAAAVEDEPLQQTETSNSDKLNKRDKGNKNVRLKDDKANKPIEEVCPVDDGKVEESDKNINRVVRIFTRSGRKVKQPGFVRNYELNESDDSDNDIDTDSPSEVNKYWKFVPSKGLKRKRGKRKNWQGIKRFPNSVSSSAVNIKAADSKVDGSEKVASNTCTSENKSDVSPKKRSPAISLILTKNLSDRKGIKRYYEDKMPFKYFCSICSYKAKRASHLEKHTALHKKNPSMKLFNCEVCDFVTIRKSVLHRHWVTHFESTEKATNAASVKNALDKEGNLMSAEQLVGIESPQEESSVGRPVSQLMQNHEKNHTGPSGKPVPYCKLCQREFPDLTKNTSKTEGLHKAPLFQCKLCNYQTARKLNFLRHQRGVHSDLRPHLCDLCGMAFKRSDGLKAHKESHLDRGQRKLPFPCKQCGKRFKSLAHLKEHSTVHTTTRSFQCDICGQMFKTINVQRRHVLSVHYKSNWLNCPFCKKSFSSKYTLKRHLNSHVGENIDGVDISTDSTKLLVDKISKLLKYHGKLGHGQNEELDENINAIKTITVTSENMEELAEQLESGHISSVGEIGEVYIQEIQDGNPNTVNIVSLKGEDLSKILIPSSVSDTQVEDLDLVGGGLKLIHHSTASIPAGTSAMSTLKDVHMGNIIPSETIKKTYSVSLLNPNGSDVVVIENQTKPADEINFETITTDQILDGGHIVNISGPIDEDGQILNISEGQNICEGQIVNINEGHTVSEEGHIVSISEGQIIGDEGQILSISEGQIIGDEGQILSISDGQIIDGGQIVELYGQTYRLKWDGSQPTLCFEAQSESQE